MRFRPLFSLTVCLASVATVAGVYAQVAKTPLVPSTSDEGRIQIRSSSGLYDDSAGIARATKDVTIVQTGEDFILYAQDVTYNKIKNQAVATGKLRIETRNSTIRGNRIFADFEKKIITITGSVVINTQGKGDGITGNGRAINPEYAKKPSKITCDRADWNYEDREATLTGSLRMIQEKNSGTCDRIVYDEEQNIAQLIGNVRFRDKDNQLFKTPNLIVYIDEGKISTNSRLHVDFNARPRTAATAIPTKKAPRFGPPPKITDDQIKQFDITPQPLPPVAPAPIETVEPAAPEPAVPETTE